MGRYQIALEKKPKKIELNKSDTKKIDISNKSELKQSYFTDLKVMMEFMAEKGGNWIPEKDLYFEEIPLVAYKSDNEMVVITAKDMHLTEKNITEMDRKSFRSEKPLRFKKFFE